MNLIKASSMKEIRVLIVDDNRENRALLKKLVLKEGCSVSELADGSEVLAKCEAGECDIVLLDIMMPGIDGIEVCKTLRRKFSRLELPIVLVSALKSEMDVLKGMQAGANDYITKPIDIPLFMDKLRALISMVKFSQSMENMRDKELI